MTRERRASERARATASVGPRSRAFERTAPALAVTLLAAVALGACRQTVVLDSPVSADAAATGTGAGSDDGASADDSQESGAAGDGGTSGNGRSDGGRSDSPIFCFGSQILYLSFTMRSPQVIFAVDRSQVMQSTFGDGTRLQVVQSLVEALLTKYDRTIHFGYEEFPSTMSTCSTASGAPTFPVGMPGGGMLPAQGCCAGDATLFALDGAGSLASLLKTCDGSSSNSGACFQSQRPTADALAKCGHTFSLLNDAGHNRYVVLLTGGDPTCMGSDANTTPCDSAVAEVTKLNLASVDTAVFEVGADASSTSACLDKLATAGGQGSGDTSPLYHRDSTPGELSEDLAAVVQTWAEEACQLDLSRAPADASKVSLLFDNVEVPVDPVDGWTFDAGSTVKLTVHGSWCDMMLSAHTVELVSGCAPLHR